MRFLAGLPLVPVLELFGIWLPILFHALYGFYIWYRGETNVGEYPWTGNWMYTAQRWTGGIAFAYILWHTWTMRFSGVDLHQYPGASFGKVQGEIFQTPLFLFYVVGLIAASWHFAYGIWLFCAKWGIVSGEKARKRFLIACLAFFFVLTGAGLASLTSFRSHAKQPTDPAGASMVETGSDAPEIGGYGKRYIRRWQQIRKSSLSAEDWQVFLRLLSKSQRWAVKLICFPSSP